MYKIIKTSNETKLLNTNYRMMHRSGTETLDIYLYNGTYQIYLK